jgi:membrane protease subunit HflK
MESRNAPATSAAGTPDVGPPGNGALRRLVAAVHGILAALGLEGRGRRVALGFLALAWVLSGIYRVEPDEQGVVLRFGRWVDTVEPGLHYHLPYPVSRVMLPKVTQVNELQLGGAAEFQPDGDGR